MNIYNNLPVYKLYRQSSAYPLTVIYFRHASGGGGYWNGEPNRENAILLRLFFSESEVDDEVIDERPLENKSDNFNNLVNHVNEQTAAVSFSDENGQKIR
jgi:hypothetical protein